LLTETLHRRELAVCASNGPEHAQQGLYREPPLYIHSTSSARARIKGAIAMPSAIAVLKLMSGSTSVAARASASK
jgi:hypothetical protein